MDSNNGLKFKSPTHCPDQKPRVVKVDLTSNKSQPPAAILVKYVDSSVNDLESMKTSMYVPVTTNDNSKVAPRFVVGAKPKPVFGKRHRPVVPIMPRHRLELTNAADLGTHFTSTTIVSGASQGEATIIHGPLTNYERYIKANVNLEFNGDVKNANLIVQSNEIVLDTLQETSLSAGLEDNEVQTVHLIGDFPNTKKDSVNPAIKETFISTKPSPGTCFVSVHGAGFKGNEKKFPKTLKIIGNGRSRMLADNLTCIPVSEFKAQLNDTSDVIAPLNIAPPVKQLLHLLHKGNTVSAKGKVGVIDMFENPGRRLGLKILKTYTRHLHTRQISPEETFPDMELLPLGYTPQIDLSKVKRITRRRVYPEAEEYRRNQRLVKEPIPLRFEHFITESEGIETKFLHEEEILPSSDETDPIFVEESLNSLKKEVHEGMMCLYTDDVTVESENILTENQDSLLDGSTIIMLQENQTPGRKIKQPKSIEVLLAAAEKQGINRTNIQKVIFCQTGNVERERAALENAVPTLH